MDYDALLTLSQDYLSRSLYVSGFSYGLLLTLASNAHNRKFWHVAGQPPTDSEWDEIDTQISNCLDEMMTNADIGSVVALMTDVIPERFLLCDGGTYQRENYPTLYTVLPASLIIDADSFSLPDMAGLATVGATIARPLLTTFGSETHTLTEPELAIHAHPYTPPVSDLDLEDVGAPTVGAAVGLLPANTGTAGGGQPHNNLQPSISLYWCIVAK